MGQIKFRISRRRDGGDAAWVHQGIEIVLPDQQLAAQEDRDRQRKVKPFMNLEPKPTKRRFVARSRFWQRTSVSLQHDPAISQSTGARPHSVDLTAATPAHRSSVGTLAFDRPFASLMNHRPDNARKASSDPSIIRLMVIVPSVASK